MGGICRCRIQDKDNSCEKIRGIPGNGESHTSRFEMKVQDVISAGVSRKGLKRRKNDDRFMIKALDNEHLLLAVSDGMGGHPAGDIAADDIMDCLKQIGDHLIDKTKSITAAINKADKIVGNRVKKDAAFEGMGATATAAIICNTKVWWAHIGDSRLYLLRGGVLQQKTKDHSFLQDLVDGGDISAIDAENHPMSHVLDQCVGCMDAGVDSGTFALLPGDKIILCTDGLYRLISDNRIAEILSTQNSVSGYVEQLIDKAIQARASDDTTIVVAALKALPQDEIYFNSDD